MEPAPSFIASAHLRVLLVPIHPIKRGEFERFKDRIRKCGARIPLNEVPRDPRGDRATFSSSPTTPGHLLFQYETPNSYASSSHALSFLSDLQPHRRIHGIIGIFSSSSFASPRSLTDALAAFHRAIAELPPGVGGGVAARKVYGFEATEAQSREARGLKEAEGLVMIPREEEDDEGFFLKTVLADFAAGVLWEFSNMAAQLESRTSIPTPQPTPTLASPFAFLPSKPSAQSSLTSYTATPSTSASSPPPKPNLAPLGIAPPPISRTALGLWGGSQSGNQEGYLYGNAIASAGNMQLASAAVGAGQASPSGAGPGVVDQKARKKVQGREKKLMGDMWLLTGRINEAIACYNEAILLTKPHPHDLVWYASALEGVCVALVLQASLSSPPSSIAVKPPPIRPTSPPPRSSTPTITPSPFDATRELLSSITDRLSLASDAYLRSLPPPSSLLPSYEGPPLDPDRAHPLLPAECALKAASFLGSVWEEGGDVASAVRALCTSSPPRAPQREGDAQTRALAPSNPVQRTAIAQHLSAAYLPHLASVPLTTRVRLLGEIASGFGKIAYSRKKAFVLRELAGAIGEGVAAAISQQGRDERRMAGLGGIAEEGDEHSLSRSNGVESRGRASPPTATVSTSSIDSTGNEAVILILEEVCRSFGIPVVVPRARRKDERRKSLLQGQSQDRDGVEEERTRFGWPSLQMGVLRDAISVAEALPDYQSAIRLTVSALRLLSSTMPPSEQFELSQNIPRVFSAATRRGAAFELEYWGPAQLLMSLEVAPLSPNRLPFEHPYQDVSANAKSSVTSLANRDPFIYSPNRPGGAQAKVRPTLVQQEPVEIFVTLQNPYLFDLDIVNIELSTSGVSFASEPLATSIPPGSFHTVRLRGTPLAAGLLIVRGCFIRLAGCTSREFLLPVVAEAEEQQRAKTAILDTSRERIKVTGLGAFVDSEDEADGQEGDQESAGLQFLECTVVPEMPMLWMRSTSLTHGALMLYDGEVSTIRIALENTSTSPVDFVKLTFTDSHTSSSEAYIAEHELSPGDAYEIQSENLQRPVFRWESETAPLVLPGQSTILEVKCLGKVGCGSGTIQLDYGFVGRPAVKSSGIFHTRQIFCDIFMTVHRALVAHSLDVLRLKALPEAATAHGRTASVAHLGRRGAALDQRLEESLKDVDDGEHCLVSVDVMNAYGKPFEVKVERCEDGNDFYQVRQLIEPGATLRMLLRLDRIVIPPEQLAQPIPSLSDRQFVVAKVQQSVEEERISRELFWYREELLQRIQASWNEVGSLRSGSISLRGLQLTKPMLDILRGDDVDIQLYLDDNPSAEPGAFQFKGRGRRLVYSAMANEFIDICATIENNSPFTLHLNLRLELRPPESTRATPAALAHLARYVVIEGVSPVSVPALEPGESQTVRVSICLLAEGQFELGCVVEERNIAEVNEGARERRSYGAREPLAITVDR